MLTHYLRGLFLCITLCVAFSALHAQQKKPNILWVTCEDISPFIGAYGDKVVKTPNIDQLAKEGVRYTNVFTTAGVCAPSRSSIITGMYQTSIGTQHMRTLGIGKGISPKKDSVIFPYSAVIPDYVKCFPEYLRKAGYYCTNNEKQDYQFEAPVTVWDENSTAASFRNRPAGKPFFAIFNFGITHESQLFGRTDSLLVKEDEVSVPPIYPDTKTVRHDIARMLTNIERMDQEVGELIAMLKEDGLYNNTIIFFYSDHGGVLPWMKREVLERGTHIPFIIRFPGGNNAGTVNNELINAVDFAPTVLSLAGVPIPSYMQGQAFLGTQKAKTARKYVFAARDRMDERYDRVRMVRDKQFRYLYNYMPEKIYYQDIEYRLHVPMMKEILELRNEGKLNATQLSWFNTKPVEELYNVKDDPYELHNLATDNKYRSKLGELRTAFRQWTKKVGDMGGLPEREMVKQMWNGGDEAPATAVPEITQSANGVKLYCQTKGASIGYRITHAGNTQQPAWHTVHSWDMAFAFGAVKNGSRRPEAIVWSVYNGESIALQAGDTLHVNAMRIGYRPAIESYVNGKLVQQPPGDTLRMNANRIANKPAVESDVNGKLVQQPPGDTLRMNASRTANKPALESSTSGKPVQSNPAMAKRPNIVFILADDIGYECFGSYGSASYQTPYIDRLAAAGIRFTHCYSTPLCTPSRVMLMTGKYNFRNYEDFGYLNPLEKTFGNIFRDAGYSTCISGKWQLNGIAQKRTGWEDTKRPNGFGFDEYCLWQLQYPKRDGERYANPLIVQNGITLPRQRDAYGPDIFCNYILDFIERKKNDDKPFFVYYTMPLVHDPFVPTPDNSHWSDTAGRYKEDTAYFKSMVAYMDKNVGAVIEKLEQTGVAANTLVIFAGDNGTNRHITSQMKNGQAVKGDKGYLTDGGTHVPLIGYWKGKSLRGAVNADLIDFSDFLPTLTSAAGITLPEKFIVDGRSFLPQILGQPSKPRDHVYMYYEPRWAGFENGVFVRDKTYKLYGDGRFYNVEKDVSEKNNLGDKTLTPQEQGIKTRFRSILKNMPAVQPLSEAEKQKWKGLRPDS